MIRSILLSAVILALGPIPLFAQTTSWNVRPWDTRIDATWVRQNIVGTTVTFIDGGAAHYNADGSYAYVYQGGRTFEGNYDVTKDGSVCVIFEGGQDRCDLFVLQGTRLMMITETGLRFPQAR